MANPEHLKILEQGVEAWNKWRKENPDSIPNLKKANLQGVKLKKIDLKGANLREANFREADLFMADIEKANLKSVDLQGTNLLWANLTEANLEKSNLKEADIRWAVLLNSNLKTATLLKADLQGVNLQGANLEGANLQEANLKTAHLENAKLSKANLKGANLKMAHLENATLNRANLNRANLQKACLKRANLKKTTFKGANLSEANLYQAKLNGTSLKAANLHKTNFKEIKIKLILQEMDFFHEDYNCRYQYSRVEKKRGFFIASGISNRVSYKEVHLGVATPKKVHPDSEFVARFAAYTDAHRSDVIKAIKKEAPTASPRLDLETCRWKKGAKVCIRLSVSHVEVANPDQEFIWNGAWQVIRFDVKLPADIDTDSLILKFDITVQGFPIIAIRPEIVIEKRKSEEQEGLTFIEETAPRSAFASYAKKDRKEVLGRVRSLEIFTDIDVFLDCLSIRPGEQWKESLKNEIQKRDIFWLFWSRNAIASEWVEWEWRTALKSKSITGIQPHPLESAETAPPPDELSDLQFGSMYEWYISQLS